MQLASPSLPIGAYRYSQGLEAAIENGSVNSEPSARNWIVDTLHHVVARFEAPILWRLLQAFEDRDAAAVSRWTECFVAARDTAEFCAETIQMGYSLAKLVAELHVSDDALLALLQERAEIPLPTAFAYAAVAMAVPHPAALLGMMFSWAENQVLVCVKSVPLGQVSGQRLLLSLRPEPENPAQGGTRDYPLRSADHQQDRSGSVCRRQPRCNGARRKKMRVDRLFVFTNLRSGDGVGQVIDFICEQGLIDVAYSR